MILQRVSPESSGCAICWENLLEADGEYLKRGAEENKKTIEDGAKVDDIEPILKYGSQATGGSTESSLSSQSSQDSPLKTHIPKRPRIVTLPCTHVFHADCLIPWFTRPNQTTCPTCRFNIDPDNLTRGTGARRAAPSAGVGGESAAVTPGDDLTTRDSWMADPFSIGPGASDEYLFPGATASIGLFRVVGGADGGDTVVPILSTPIGSSNPSGSPVSSSVNDEVEIRGEQKIASSVSYTNSTYWRPDLPLNETASISSNIQREDLFYSNAPRLPMARDESIPPSAEPSNVTEEQLRSFVQTILGRLFNAEAIITGSPPASSTISPPSSDGSAPNDNRDPRAEHHREPVDGFVTIGFDFVIGPNPRPPEARQAHGSSAIGRERGFNTEHRPSLFERMALGTRPPAHSSNEFDATFSVDHSGPLRETGRSVETSNLFEPNASASINQADPPHSFSFLDPAIISATSRLRETTTGGHSRRPPPRVSNYISSMLGTTNSVPGTHPQRVNVPSERRQWIPPPPGLSLRQTIEKREREAGMRCWDVSCGVGPVDEDPFVTASGDQRRQVMIRRVAATAPQEGDLKGKGKGKPAERQYACDHSFHPSCLVSAQRASLNGFQEVIAEDGKYLEVSCTVCRTPGMLPKEDWEDGVRALEI
ncbi:hypothetical protein D9757_000053 [Collybiopsis confluens]|uniref:RING-type domain-containing protein n=1 Tax=Collybiopsis confluens TaxID=2823264 RepID=A0A8H5I1X3_9AGAR|nr:hypothetical protein D9757_000053 [Collybiopsis confluens]